MNKKGLYLSIGDMVQTLTAKEPYYSGYGNLPKITIPVGTIGRVGAIKVPVVRHIKGNPYSFLCIDFKINGKDWRGAYYNEEVTKHG